MVVVDARASSSPPFFVLRFLRHTSQTRRGLALGREGERNLRERGAREYGQTWRFIACCSGSRDLESYDAVSWRGTAVSGIWRLLIRVCAPRSPITHHRRCDRDPAF